MASNADLGEQLPAAKPTSGHIHSGWFCCLDRERLMAQRILNGDCVIVYSHDEINGNDIRWCLTHNQPDLPDHAPWVAHRVNRPSPKEAG